MGKRVANATKVRAERQVESARRRLGWAVAMVLVGSFLPWGDTMYGTIVGDRAGGAWTFWGAVLGLGGVFVAPLRRRVGAALAVIFAAVATVVPTWRVVDLIGVLGLGGWLPGPGLVLVFGGGVLAATAAVQLFQPSPPD